MTDEQIGRLLQDLVRIPSVNPQGDPGTDVRNTGEAPIGAYVADFLRKLALDVEVQEVAPGRPNVIGKFCSRGSRAAVAFAPHTDTVSVGGMTIDPFGAVVRDGKLFGRGAADTKGSLAAMLAAVAAVVRQKSFRAGDLDVYFCALMGEESGNDGARALMERGFKVDFAVAGEPTDCRVVHTHKGALWFKMITHGRSVHGSMPARGESAIQKMAEVVRYLLGDYAALLAAADNAHPAGTSVLSNPTVSVGTIHGGAQINIVPDRCVIEVDRRTVPGEDHEAILEGLRAHLRPFAVATEIIRDCRPLFTDPANGFVQRLAAATAGTEPASRSAAEMLVGAAWFCDAGVMAEYGVPAVAFGPGSAAQAHTADEFVELAEVARAARIAERFLVACAASPLSGCRPA